MYVSDRNVFDNIYKKQSWDCIVSAKNILKRLLHCRANTDWHVSILDDWLNYSVMRHMSVISPTFTKSSHFQTINRNMILMTVFIIIINMSLNG